MRPLTTAFIVVLTTLVFGCSGSDNEAPTGPTESSEPSIHDYLEIVNDTGHEIVSVVEECQPGMWIKRFNLRRYFAIEVLEPLVWINHQHDFTYSITNGSDCNIESFYAEYDERLYSGDMTAEALGILYQSWFTTPDTNYVATLEDFDISPMTISCSEAENTIVVDIDDPIIGD